MGTRSLTIIYDKDKKELLCLYRQFDGYPDGHGQDLLDFTENAKLSNGLILEDKQQKRTFNGMSDFACRLVTYLKNNQERDNHSGEDLPGNFYIEGKYTGNPKDYGAEFVYSIFPNKNNQTLKIFCKPIYRDCQAFILDSKSIEAYNKNNGKIGSKEEVLSYRNMLMGWLA